MRISSSFTSLLALQYMTTKLPCLHEDLYKHCEVADVQLHVSAKF